VSEPDRSPSVLNRKARFRYHIEESLEAGLVLLGSEVKAIREGKANLTDAFVRIKKGEAFLIGCHIGAYSAAPSEAHEPVRERKLLLHRRELDRLAGKARERGYTLIVTKLYFKDGRVKAELSLGRGKQAHDKRRALRERSQREEVARAMRRRR
jgi:SsrA-binding protein